MNPATINLAYELIKFFSDVEKIIFRAPASKVYNKEDSPLICLLLVRNKLNEYCHNNINKKIQDLFDHKRMVFQFNINKLSKNVELYLANEESDELYKFTNAIIDEESVRNFITLTDLNDKIPLLIGNYDSDRIQLNQATKNNLLLILDGYKVIQE